MQRDEQENKRRNKKHLDREKAAEGRAANRVPAENKPRQPITDEWNAPRLFCSHDNRPRGILVPTQQLPGEAHD